MRRNATAIGVASLVVLAIIGAGAAFVYLSASGAPQVSQTSTSSPGIVSADPASTGPIVYVSILNAGPGVYGNPLTQPVVTVVIGVNNTVVWTNQSPGTENIVSTAGLFSGSMTYSQTFGFTFTQPGTYSYYGTGYHAFAGAVIVENSTA